jgi:hypothetical protein
MTPVTVHGNSQLMDKKTQIYEINIPAPLIGGAFYIGPRKKSAGERVFSWTLLTNAHNHHIIYMQMRIICI